MKTPAERPLAYAFVVALLAAGIPYRIDGFRSLTLPLSQVAAFLGVLIGSVLRLIARSSAPHALAR